MKKLLILLFSLFFLSSPSVFADNISDFEIEGISIGDSLLDYMTEDKILQEIEKTKNWYSYLNEPNKYSEIYLFKDFPTYDSLSFFVKNNSVNQYVTDINEKYTILFVRGLIDYIEDFDSCIQKRNEIAEVLSEMFPNAQKTERITKHSADPSGRSIIDVVLFDLDSGARIATNCQDFEETFRIEKKWSDTLNIAIQTEEVVSWFDDRY